MYPGAGDTDKESNLSVPAAATLLLVWNNPTDRALTGWSPFGCLPNGMAGDTLVGWLRDQLKISLAETHDQARMSR